MKITITIPDSVYAKLEKDRGSIPRSTYIQDLIKCFSSGPGNITPQDMLKNFEKQGGVISGVGTIPEIKNEETKVDEGWLYEELIEKLGNTLDREVDFEERSQLNKQVKDLGLIWNVYMKRLERIEDGKVKVIHQF